MYPSPQRAKGPDRFAGAARAGGAESARPADRFAGRTARSRTSSRGALPPMVQTCIFADSRRPSARPRRCARCTSRSTRRWSRSRISRSAPRARRSRCRTLAEGRTSLLLVLRSQRTGQLACFAPDETLESDASAQIALDGALSFAESMGFLFDDDAIPELGAEGPREAADSWNDLLGIEPQDLEVDPRAGSRRGSAPRSGSRSRSSRRQRRRRPSLLRARARCSARFGAPAPPRVLLTKFRRSAAPGRRSRRNGWPIRLLSHF